jgi:acyl dehydratase
VSRRLHMVPGPDVPARYAEVSGDASPLHLDEKAAREAGLDGVILHGMYLFGLAVRAASADVDDDPRRVLSAQAQFRSPGIPGSELTVDVAPDAAEPSSRSVRVCQGGTDLLRNARVVLAD